MRSLLEQGPAMQAASIGKTLADYSIFNIECPNCRGFMVDSQDQPCRRCDGGYVEVKRKIVERKEETT